MGEPWWWITPDGRPCLYDAAARQHFGAGTVEIARVQAVTTAAERALLDSAGALLAASTAALVAAVRAVAPTVETHVLV
ncbi:non-contractile tail sheath protein, partial [Clostridium perfringens]